MKKILSLIISFAMVAMTTAVAFANEVQANSNLEALQELPYNEKLDRLEWHDYTSLENIRKEDTYTYDELVAYLRDNGFFEEEILVFTGERPVESRAASVHYGLMKMSEYQHGSYTTQFRVNVGLEYIGNSSSPSRIVALKGAHVYTPKNSVFTGDIFYELIAGNEFYYNYYGKLYKSGNVQWSVGATIGIGESASITGTISNSDGEIDSIDHYETYYSKGLTP